METFPSRIAITKPSITKLEIDYVTDAITNGWGSKCYDYIYRFEKEFANYLVANTVWQHLVALVQFI